MIPFIKKFNKFYYRILCVFTTAIAGLLLVPVTLQVLSRYTSFIPTWVWTEEAARFCLVWMIMLGAAIAIRNRTHFDIDILPEPKTVRGQVFLQMLIDMSIAVFGVIFFWVSVEYTFDAQNEMSEITEISMSWMYLCFPLSTAGWLLFLGEHIYDDICTLKRGFV